MRYPRPSPLALVVALIAACATSSAGQGEGTGGAEATGAPAPAEPVEPAAASETGSPDATIVHEPRLAPCQPGALDLASAPAVSVTLVRAPFGCLPREATPLAERDDASIARFAEMHPEGWSATAVRSRATFAERFTCDGTPALPDALFDDSQYVVFHALGTDRTEYRVPFAADAGDAIHVGLQEVTPCSGVAVERAVVGRALLVPERERPVVIHVCAGDPDRCGPVP